MTNDSQSRLRSLVLSPVRALGTTVRKSVGAVPLGPAGRDRTSHVEVITYIAVTYLILGLLSAIGAILFPEAQFVLLAFAGTGLFIATLALVIVPGDSVPASLYEQLYRSYAELGAITGTDTFVYVPQSPTEGTTGGTTRLLVSTSHDGTGSASPELESDRQLLDEGRGAPRGIQPLGESLFQDFQSHLVGPLGSTPSEIASQLVDAIEKGWGFATRVEPTRERADEYTFAVDGSVCEPVDRFDHPIVSFLGVGLAAGLNTPVRVSVSDRGEYSDYVITCAWDRGMASTGVENADG